MNNNKHTEGIEFQLAAKRFPFVDNDIEGAEFHNEEMERWRTMFISGYQANTVDKELEQELLKTNQAWDCDKAALSELQRKLTDREKQLDILKPLNTELLEALKELFKFIKELNPDLKPNSMIPLWHDNIKPQIEEAIKNANKDFERGSMSGDNKNAIIR